jgi:hypothetical protein
MRYFIAGGGRHGNRYLKKLSRPEVAPLSTMSEIVVVDRDPDCRAASWWQPSRTHALK